MKKMNILEEIIGHKRTEVKERKALFPEKLLEKSIFFDSKPVSLKEYITRPDKIGLIAEIKRQSPSKGVINKHVSIERTSIGYMQAGASGLSILTDTKYFGGNSNDLEVARKYNYCPILRKDFIIDEYQIIEAKSIGADVVLLIAAGLETSEVKSLSAFAKSLGLEVLLEVHNGQELSRSICESVDLVGVNNRDLKSFSTSVETSLELVEQIPSQFVKVSESGISNPQTVVDLKNAGFDGFLIGEYFMQFGRPDIACRDFVNKVKELDRKGIDNVVA